METLRVFELGLMKLIFAFVSCLKGRAVRLFVPAAHAPEMPRGAFRERAAGGRRQAAHDLALLFREFMPRAQARRVAARATDFGRCHRANIDGLEAIAQEADALKSADSRKRRVRAQRCAQRKTAAPSIVRRSS